MFRFVSIFAILASVAAFAPMSRVARSSAVAGWKGNSAFENEIGVQAPLGLYDPLNLLDGADQARFDRLREVETKHGRISMLAILGHLVTTAGVRLPGVLNEGGADAIAFKDIRAGLAAFEDIPTAGLVQLFVFIGLIEYGYSLRKEEIEQVQLEKSKWDEETINKKLAIELNNGRAAQMGILGLMVHEKIDNNPYVLNSLLGFPVKFN